jgi:hypothetical protein
MLDTIRLGMQVKNPDDIVKTGAGKLHRHSITGDDDGVLIRTSFTVDNLRVAITQNSLRVEGSLPRYYFGNNVQELDFDTMQKAFDKLSNQLGINIGEADLYKIHIAGNIQVEKDCRYYFPLFNYLPNHHRHEYNNGVTFWNHYRALAIYDKVKESKNKDNIPAGLLKGNLLRVEARLNKDPKDRFNLENLKVQKLYEAEFYNSAINYWYQIYSKVTKTIPSIPLTGSQSNKEFQKSLMLLGVQKSGGLDRVMNMLKLQSKLSEEPPHLYRGKKEKLLSLYDTPETKHDGIIELDSKIKNKYLSQVIA